MSTGAGNTGTKTCPPDPASERVSAVITNIPTAPPARTRHPTATSRLDQRRRCSAWCPKTSQFGVSLSRDQLRRTGTSLGVALRTCTGTGRFGPHPVAQSAQLLNRQDLTSIRLIHQPVCINPAPPPRHPRADNGPQSPSSLCGILAPLRLPGAPIQLRVFLTRAAGAYRASVSR